MYFRLAYGLTMFGLFCLAPLGNAATAVSTVLEVSSYMDINTSDNNSGPNNWSNWSQLGTINPMAVNSAVSDTSGNNNGFASSSATASWNDANSGLVTFDNVGWTLNTTAPYLVKLNQAFTGNKIWEYTFIANGNGLFQMAYNVAGAGDLFGLQGAIIDWTGPGGGITPGTAVDPTANGLFSRAITVGQQYTVSVSNYANIFGDSGTVREGYHSGTFEWRITESAVPGPAAALPFVGGLLMALKRRRK